MDIFKFNDYRALIKAYVKSLPKNGHGEMQRLAEALSIHPTSLSQVIKGAKEFTFEQVGRLCKYLNLNEIESEYVVCLVELERAGSEDLKKIYISRKRRLIAVSSDVNQRVPKDTVLSVSDRAQYYSQWYYAAIRLICDIPEIQTAEKIASHLNLPLAKVSEALNFLTETGLCIEVNGQYKMGQQRNFIEKNSPLFTRHLNNWRQKSIQQIDKCDPDIDYLFSCAMTLSRKDREKVRAVLFEATQEILKFTLESKSEELVILNIDWLRI